ncbi:unnamed protein product [Cuscuta europaea]|uniref:GATA-type domain-containing protein n=1 Tax=Cuscuta europaea TaxID=41803 RepID=A0A9P1E5N0_CUSEU|nr:unnamed protein product [Cuscuta europaea]
MGPPEKPVLCNACGSRWRLKGNLNGYVPKHAMRDTPSDHHTLSFEMKYQQRIINSQQKVKPEGSDMSSTSPKEDQSGTSSSESSIPSPEKCIQGAQVIVMGEANQSKSTWNANNVTRKKRSTLEEQSYSSIDTFYLQLQHIQNDIVDENNISYQEGEDTLIYQKWQCIPDNEIGFGATTLSPLK